jgi:hypothetical protein
MPGQFCKAGNITMYYYYYVNRMSTAEHSISIISSSTLVFLKVQCWDPIFTPCMSYYWHGLFGRFKYAIICADDTQVYISLSRNNSGVQLETLKRWVSKVQKKWLLHGELTNSQVRTPTSSKQLPLKALESYWIQL